MQQFDIKKPLPHKPLFNPDGDTDVLKRRMIGGNTTNLNDYNNLKYTWASEWYRQAMNNFWIPEEINLSQDIKDYPNLSPAERKAYDKILSFLVFLDSIQTANLPCVGEYITANEVNLCLNIQTFQECVHSQSYSYMLDTICSPDERMDILYQWKTDEHLLKRNTFIGECYNEFQVKKDARTLVKVMMANFVLEGIYFFSGFMFFYNLSRNGKMPGSAQEIRYINRDENTHLWLFRNIIIELRKEHPELFDDHMVSEMKELLMEAVRQEIEWACYVIGNEVPGLNEKMITDYIRYLGNLRWKSLGYAMIFYLSALEKVPAELYEANSLDGANAWQRFRDVTLPCISPTTFFLLIVTMVNSLQAYDQIQILTQGGPSGSTRTLLYMYYQLGFEEYDMGQATAVAMVLVVITLILSGVQFLASKKWVHY